MVGIPWGVMQSGHGSGLFWWIAGFQFHPILGDEKAQLRGSGGFWGGKGNQDRRVGINFHWSPVGRFIAIEIGKFD